MTRDIRKVDKIFDSFERGMKKLLDFEENSVSYTLSQLNRKNIYVSHINPNLALDGNNFEQKDASPFFIVVMCIGQVSFIMRITGNILLTISMELLLDFV